MKRYQLLLVICMPLAAGFSGCSDDSDPEDSIGASGAGGSEPTGPGGVSGAGGFDGNAQCRELGEYCHEAGEKDPAAEECHEVMHAADDGCLDRYEECQTLCETILAEAGGAGGEGGAMVHAGGTGGHG